MVDSVFPCYPLEQAARDALLDALRTDRALWTPQTGTDGVCRLQPASPGPLPAMALPGFLPLKKLLLPTREALWRFHSGRFCAARAPQSVAVVGVPLCDLQAAWYLDQVFVDDLSYQARRAQTLLVGMACEPGPECRCDGRLMPLAGDLFINSERAWALSPAGDALLRACGCLTPEELPLPWPGGVAERRHELAEELYRSAIDATVWTEEARRCLSCGACSAVCPTCYCFDMLDAAALDGTVTRHLVWDNCFFAEHGKVAGGHDFRPGRADRLRFRMEHKRFGFGSLHGQNSCVGCGRCRSACPVDIDLDRIAERLDGEGGQ
jgi:sulfhydrogenase subunit beta (sulfur reductase)